MDMNSRFYYVELRTQIIFKYIVIVPTTVFSAVWQRPHTCCAKCDTICID